MDVFPAQEKNANLTQESFDRLLTWLHPDREAAGRIYEDIRSKLIKCFRAHGCSAPEDLADETINRVARKSSDFVHRYVGDPARYFYCVAHYVHLEHLRKDVEAVELTEDLPMQIDREDVEPEYECLERCMEHLPARNRELVSKYYQGEKRIKIELRKQLASKLNINLPTLRLQAQRIRAKLKKCIQECLRQKLA